MERRKGEQYGASYYSLQCLQLPLAHLTVYRLSREYYSMVRFPPALVPWFVGLACVLGSVKAEIVSRGTTANARSTHGEQKVRTAATAKSTKAKSTTAMHAKSTRSQQEITEKASRTQEGGHGHSHHSGHSGHVSHHRRFRHDDDDDEAN